MTTPPQIRDMTMQDYEEVYALWEKSEGVKVSAQDSREDIEQYLNRNPRLSLVAEQEGRIVGSILCGTDGRRGYLQHLCVEDAFRGQGVASEMIRRVKSRFSDLGIHHLRIFVLRDNPAGRQFWEHRGWRAREDILPMAIEL